MRSHKWFTPYVLVAPAVIWVLVFGIWPFLNTVVLAFTDARPLQAPKPVGLDNFARLFGDDRFLYSLTTVLVYVAVCVPLLTLGPLLVALLVQTKIPGIAFFRTTFYFPVVASVVVVGMIWQWMFDSEGIVNQSLQFLGADGSVNFLVDRWKLILVSISLTVWKGLGYYMVVYLAALASVGRELHEAAAIDGANAYHRFWNVTVPGVRGGMLLVAALISVSAMRVFTELYVLTNGTGGPGGQAMSIVMMVQSVGKGLNGQIGYASAISVVLFLLTIGPLAFVGVMNYGKDIKLPRRKSRSNGTAGRIDRPLQDSPGVAAAVGAPKIGGDGGGGVQW
ncbi:MAG: sugar ABC transporter permease [Arachnia sp.]